MSLTAVACRRAAAWVAAVLSLAHAGAAVALDADRGTGRTVTISLKGPAEERPQFVCVAQTAPASGEDAPADRSEDLWLLLTKDSPLEEQPDGSWRFPADPQPLVCAAAELEARAAMEPPGEPPEERPGRGAVRSGPTAAPGTLRKPGWWEGRWCNATMGPGGLTLAIRKQLSPKRQDVVEALLALGRRTTDDAACDARLAACDATVRFERDRPVYVTCTRNSQGLRGTQRVLVLHYRSQAGALVDTVGFDGSTVTLTLAEREEDGSTGLVSGGHYRADLDGVTTAGQMPLPLRALCVQRDLRLPAVGGASGTPLTVTVDRSGAGWPGTCRSPQANPLRLWLPRQAAAVEKSLSAELRRPDGALVARFSAGWHDATPPPQLPLGLETVTFEWQPPCEYTAAFDCPAAILVEPGIECRGEPVFVTPLRCRYECPGSANPTSRFGLPATVSMGAPDQGRWSVRLSSAGQVVGGYVADKRPFFVHLPFLVPAEPRDGDADKNLLDEAAGALALAEPTAIRDRLRWHGDAIDALRLRTSSGQVVLVPIEGSSQRVLLPDAICGDFLRYRYEGDREYDERTIRIDRADIVLPDPNETARKLWLGVLVAGGTAHADGPGIDRWTPTLVTELTGRWRPARGWVADLGLSFELSASWTLGGWPYEPVTYDRRARTQQVLRNRFTFTLAGVHTFGRDFDVGLSLGGGVASPLYYSRDREFIRPAVGFFAGALFLRYRLTRRVSLELTAPRFFAPEVIYSYHSNLFEGDPVRRGHDAWSLGLDLGVRIWL